jgi:hypothetical protein
MGNKPSEGATDTGQVDKSRNGRDRDVPLTGQLAGHKRWVYGYEMCARNEAKG